MESSTIEHQKMLKSVVTALSKEDGPVNMCHKRRQGEPLPSEVMIAKIVDLCRSVLFPGYFGEGDINSYNLEYFIGTQCERIHHMLAEQIYAGYIATQNCKSSDFNPSELREKAQITATKFVSALPDIRRKLQGDVHATYLGDPAAVSHEEVIYCYPGIKAICNYRIANALYKSGAPIIISRIITELAHSETGIDIHPTAEIGENFAIDHGTGVVIGATAIIGANVKLYQGVTLGARSFTLDTDGNPIKGIARHPILGDNVVIYSNATILGRITIGDNAIVGGNIWVTEDVAPGEKLIQAKANNILRVKNDE